MDFSQILSGLMKENQVSAYRLAKTIGVHQTTIKNWLDGKRPCFEHLHQVAGFFHVSTDVLLGKSAGDVSPIKESAVPVKDPSLILLCRKVENAPADKREAITKMLNESIDQYLKLMQSQPDKGE